MKRRIVLIFLLPYFLLTGCDSWLDIVPEEDMTTIDSDFETREEAYNWFKSCYVFLEWSIADVKINEAFVGSDEFVYGSYLLNSAVNSPLFEGAYIATGMQNSLNPYADCWLKREGSQGSQSVEVLGRNDYYTAINLCTVFISKIDQVYNMDAKEKTEWKAEVLAVKAYYYFELVRHYGPIVLVPENIDPNVDVEEMKRLLETTPGKLSLYEMYQIASTYEEGSDEYNELVEIMVHLFPNDEVANLNAANVAMYKEDLESAEKYLGKAGQGPEAVYARGLLAALKGDYATAEQYVTEAGEQGVAEAAECLERIRRAALE